jgi:hypothetical protein
VIEWVGSQIDRLAGAKIWAPSRCTPNSKFLHSLSITSILEHMHGAVNVCKKITNCTV